MNADPGVWFGDDFRDRRTLDARARALASRLSGPNRAPGPTVLMLGRNSFLPIEVMRAVSLIGGRLVPVTPHAAPAEIAYLLADSGASIVVGDADVVVSLRAQFEGVRVIAQRTPDLLASTFAVADAARAVPPWCEDYDEAVDSPAGADSIETAPSTEASLEGLFYTSGTTGHPKGVVRDRADADQVRERREVMRTCFGVRPGSRGLVTTPLCHLFGSAFAQGVLDAGGTVVVMARFDPPEFLRLVERHAITTTQVVPTMFVRLLRLDRLEREAFDRSTLEYVVHSGAPCASTTKRAAIEWLGPIVWEQYGSTETGVVARCDSADWLAHPGTVGRAFASSELRVYSDSGELCPPGTPGSVYARMHAIPDFTYLGRPEARAEVGRDGLIGVGDIGQLDEDGFLYLLDRRSDLILSGGNNVYPAEIEAVLGEHPSVADCAVFGVPDEEFGQRAVAAVSLRPGGAAVTGAELEAFARGALAGYKAPREYLLVDDIPRTDTGKLLRRVMREDYLAARSAG